MVLPPNHERELPKLEALSNALATALKARSVPYLPAALEARAGTDAFADATLSWLDNEEPSLGERLDLAEQTLRNLI
jgi:hypothetical protein